MAKKVQKNSAAYKAGYLLKNLRLKLTEKVESEGYTLDYKIIKMGKRNYKFINVFFNGKSLGTVDPYTILYFCNSSTFINVHQKALRERIGDILHIAPPEEEMFVTETLLKNMLQIRYFNIYGDYSKPHRGDDIEVSSEVIEIMEDSYNIES